jgi:hypothetical protein
MISRTAALAASLMLAGIGSAYAATASGEVEYVDAQHKTMSLVGARSSPSPTGPCPKSRDPHGRGAA